MPPIDYIEIGLILCAIPILWLAFRYAAWETWDDDRRHARKVHRNLLSQSGGRYITDWSDDASL